MKTKKWIVRSGVMTWRGPAPTYDAAAKKAIRTKLPKALGLLTSVAPLGFEDTDAEQFVLTTRLLAEMGMFQDSPNGGK